MEKLFHAVGKRASRLFSWNMGSLFPVRFDTKRAFDISLSLPLLILFLCLFPLIACCVLYRSKGNIFYSQERYGLNQKKFRIYKLRTLHQHLCDDGARQVTANDPRITRAGKWLRRFYIDELPQLYNVLIGDMSLIGPRPHAIAMDDYYGRYISGYTARYAVKPGLSGLAQVYGWRGETPRIGDMEKRLEYDLKYIRHRSLWLDLVILRRTFGVVLNMAG